MRYLPIMAILLSLLFAPAVSESAYPNVSSVIDQFVSQVYPKGSHYFWVINDTTSEVSNEIIVDINTELQVEFRRGCPAKPLLTSPGQRKLIGAQQISLGAKVDCHS